jgi:hypothetical protein
MASIFANRHVPRAAASVARYPRIAEEFAAAAARDETERFLAR